VPAARPWTPKALLEWSEGYFRGKGIASPRLDAELLLAHVLGLRRLDLYLQFDRPVGPPELARYRELVRKRADRVPVAYLTGEVGFWNLTLDIAPGCLIPRPDTETLVEAVLAALADLRGGAQTGGAQDGRTPGAGSEAPGTTVVLELGPGSAAIPLAVCSEVEGLTWIAVERSREALAVARRNRVRHAALLQPRRNRLWLIEGDGFAALRADARADLIVSNPPYIPSAAIAGLMREVSQAEPRLALDAGADGLTFHRLLVAEAAARLQPQGRLLLELGHDQLAAVRGLLAGARELEEAGVRNDLGGHARVLDVRRRGVAAAL
jgi:release factor glutamine methyltransferase